MAPALTEPLSPTDKLTKSAATSVPVTRSTRRSRAAAAAAAAETTVVDTEKTQPISVIKTTTSTVGNKERKTRNNSTTAAAVAAVPVTVKTTTTTRVTRSKDNANQRLSEQAAIPAESNSSQATTSCSKSNNDNSINIKIQKEPMAISAALDSSNNNNNNPQTSTSTKKDNGNKSDSTEKILADLATNIEEAISAEICLRKQLCDVNLSSEDAEKNTNGGTELKDIDFIINSSGSAVDQELPEENSQIQCSMDPVLKTIKNNTLDEIIEGTLFNKQPDNENDHIKECESADIIKNEEIPTTESSENITITTTETTNLHLDELAEIIANEEQLLQEAINKEIVETTAVSNEEITRTTTTTIDTADDGFDDTIEARLSQLDGNVILNTAQTTTEIATTTIIDDEISNSKIIPRSIQEDLLDLQEQLQLSDATTAAATTINTTLIENINLEQQQDQQRHQQQLQLQEEEMTVEKDGQEQHHYNMESTNINMQIVDGGVDGTAELVDQEELVEEVLKVLKGFDPATANADTLSDLNALFAFSDVYQNMNTYDDVNVTATTTAVSEIPLNASVANTTHDGDISGDGGVGVHDDNDGAGNAVTTSAQCNVNWLEDEQQEIVRAQQVIQRKMDYLVRKLRKTQARYMCKHASEEIAGVIEYAVRAANNKLHSVGTPDNSHLMSVISARPPPEVWQEERESPIPSAEVYALLRKLEISAKTQQLYKATNTTTTTTAVGTTIADGSSRKPRKSALSMDVITSPASTLANTTVISPSATTTPQSITQTMTIDGNIKTNATSLPTTITNKELESVIPTFDMLAVKEMSQVTGMLQTEMREVQLAIDSDATESSSGCESADELITYNNQIQQPLEM